MAMKRMPINVINIFSNVCDIHESYLIYKVLFLPGSPFITSFYGAKAMEKCQGQDI